MRAVLSVPPSVRPAGGEALDECGLRYLLAMRLHTCLLTSLPPLYRMQLLHQGKRLPMHQHWTHWSLSDQRDLQRVNQNTDR